MKVMFRPEIREELEKNFRLSQEKWEGVHDGTGIIYRRDFLIPKYFNVKDAIDNDSCFKIIDDELWGYIVDSRHVMPYCPIELDDNVFEWKE